MIAEVLGLSGTPAKAVEVENILLIVLLFTFIVTAIGRFLRRWSLVLTYEYWENRDEH